MAYRKRIVRRKRVVRSKRVIKRRVRKTVRRKSNRVASSRMYVTSEQIDLADFQCASVASTFTYAFDIGAFPRLNALKNNFNEFKIVKATLKVVPKQFPGFYSGNTVDPGITSIAEPLRMITWSTKNNSYGANLKVDSYNEAICQPGSKMHSLTRGATRSGRVYCSQGYFATGTTVVSRAIPAPWVRVYDNTGAVATTPVLHDGWGVYTPAIFTPVPASPRFMFPAFTVVKAITVAFRGKRLSA